MVKHNKFGIDYAVRDWEPEEVKQDKQKYADREMDSYVARAISDGRHYHIVSTGWQEKENSFPSIKLYSRIDSVFVADPEAAEDFELTWIPDLPSDWTTYRTPSGKIFERVSKNIWKLVGFFRKPSYKF